MLGSGANVLSSLTRSFQCGVRELLDRIISTLTEGIDYGAGASVDGSRSTRNNTNDIESRRVYGALRKGFFYFSFMLIS